VISANLAKITRIQVLRHFTMLRAKVKRAGVFVAQVLWHHPMDGCQQPVGTLKTMEQDQAGRPRVYLVIVDETPEAARALRFAARRALRTGAQIHLLVLVPRGDFVVFGSIQATIEEEARDRAEMLASLAAGSLAGEAGPIPTIVVQSGDGPDVVRRYLRDHPEVSALVLGAAEGHAPDALAQHFAAEAGSLPCVLMIVPGGADEARIDAVS
jgi:nucleotide-binding universal stress UspA family protein